MPRTIQATIALIVTLAVIGLITMFNMWQTHNTENQVIALKLEMQKMTNLQQDIKDQLKKGVAVSGNAGTGQGSVSNGNSGGTDPYAGSLKDPKNFLKAPLKAMLPANAKKGGKLRLTAGSDPKGFNWLLENSVDVANIQALVHAGIATRDINKPENWVGDLAHKVEISPDFKEYTIHIRKGVKWQVPNLPNLSDAKFKWVRQDHEVTSADFKFYFDLIKNAQVEVAALRAYYQKMDRVEIIDDYTFKVFWSEKTTTSISSTLSAYPMPKWLFTRNEDGTEIEAATLGLKFNNHWSSAYPIGAGPYRFIKFNKGVDIVLERDERYWGNKPAPQRIEYTIVKDAESRLIRFKSNSVDTLGMTASQYNKEILSGKNTPFTSGKLKHDKYDVLGYSYLGWNADKPFFKDKLVRQAMTHAFNRKDIIENVYYGLGSVQTGPFFFKHPANNPGVQAFPFDLEKAKALLDQAGWKDSDSDGIRDKVINGTKKKASFVITSYANSAEWDSALSVFKEDLRKIGVQMDFSPVDWPTMQKKMNEKKFDAFTGGWGLGWDIDPYQIWHSSQADEPKGSNRVAFRNKRADEIIETLRATFDTDERFKLLREFHMILHTEQPYTFFRAPKAVYSWQPRLKNPVSQVIRPHLNPKSWFLEGDVK